MYLYSEGSFGLRKSCTEVRRPTLWPCRGFVQKKRESHHKCHRGDYTHLIDFLRLRSMYKVVLFGGCSSRGLGGLLSKTAVSEAISGSRAVHTCCCPYCCCPYCCMAGPGSGRPSTTFENILPRERYQLVADKSLQCLPCATQVHTRR